MNRLSALLSNSKQIILPALLTGLLVVLLGCPTEAPKDKGGDDDNGIVYKYTPATKADLITAITAEIALQGDGANLNNIDTSGIEDMKDLFIGTGAFADFNGDISKWDTSNVKDMRNMFAYATVFNGDLSQWNTGKVENMAAMFANASAFDSDISKWDTRKVIDMINMFSGASKFNQNIATNGNAWNTSKVYKMSYMFENATLFNQDISKWDVSSVTNRLNRVDFATGAGFETETGKHPTWP